MLNSLRQLKEADISQTPGTFQHGEQLMFISRLFRKSDGPQTERHVLPQFFLHIPEDVKAKIKRDLLMVAN